MNFWDGNKRNRSPGRSLSNSSPTVSSSRFLPFLNCRLVVVACRREVFFYYASREGGARKSVPLRRSFCLATVRRSRVSRLKASFLTPSFPFVPVSSKLQSLSRLDVYPPVRTRERERDRRSAKGLPSPSLVLPNIDGQSTQS